MTINSVAIGLNMKGLQETLIDYMIMLAPLLIIWLVIFEFDYYGPNFIIKKNNRIKLLIDFLLLILLIFISNSVNSQFYKIWYYLSIATVAIVFIGTLQELFSVGNPILTWLYKIGFKLLSIIYFPFEIRNKLLKKLYNVDIKYEELPYLNMSLILIFLLQCVMAVLIFCLDVENYFNKYFFGFAIGTFISYFSIDVVIMLMGRNDKITRKYHFIIKKTFLIVLMVELIVIAFMANIDYNILSKLEIIRIYKLDKSALKELFDSITLCTLVLQLLEYRNTHQ